MEKIHINFTDEIISSVTNKMSYPDMADRLLERITDINLNDDISYACSECLYEGFKAGFQTALNITQGKLEFLL